MFRDCTCTSTTQKNTHTQAAALVLSRTIDEVGGEVEKPRKEGLEEEEVGDGVRKPDSRGLSAGQEDPRGEGDEGTGSARYTRAKVREAPPNVRKKKDKGERASERGAARGGSHRTEGRENTKVACDVRSR